MPLLAACQTAGPVGRIVTPSKDILASEGYRHWLDENRATPMRAPDFRADAFDGGFLNYAVNKRVVSHKTGPDGDKRCTKTITPPPVSSSTPSSITPSNASSSPSAAATILWTGRGPTSSWRGTANCSI